MSDCCEVTVVVSDEQVLIADETSDLVVITDAEQITVVDSDVTVTVSANPEYVVISDSVGVAGPPGPPGGEPFFYVQSAPAATWIIAHNLGHRAQVTLFDDSFTEVETDVVQGDVNTATAIFASPVTGSAVLI